MPHRVKAEYLTRGTSPNEQVVPFRTSVPGYDPKIEEMGMDIIGILDKLEQRGFRFAGETIGPFIMAMNDDSRQLLFTVSRTE